VNNRSTTFLQRWVSLFLLFAAVVVTIVQLVGYSRQRNNYPPGMTIAGVSVGGLTPSEASARVLEIYSLPVEVQYAGATIQIDPNVIGFELDLERMLAAADQNRTGSSFWAGFWNYLWNREATAPSIPLAFSISEDRLRNYLQTEIASRYDQPATPAQPIPGSTAFSPGQPGLELNIDRAVILIEDALQSPSNRVVSLSFEQTSPTRPSLKNLQTQVEQLIAVNGFDGVIGVYMLDLQTGQEIHFALNQGQDISVNPDVPFTASSTAKIPIMISYFLKFGKNGVDQKTSDELVKMIRLSENPPADQFMEALDPVRGPLLVTDDMRKLGLQNTFMAGYFAPGAPLLERIQTPANQRTDVYTDPDLYNQTTTSDIGMLLEDLYQCSETGGGALIAAFPGQLTQNACKQMVNFLVEDKLGALIQAGVPDGTRVAHKHGWVADAATGVIHNISDAAIVYTPGGNYILTIYAYHPIQTVWEPVSGLFAQISQAVYNYFNLSQ
jgi:hypothetical protein